MRETSMRERLVAVLRKQNPALAALVTAPPASDPRAVLEEAARYAPWSRGALEALEARSPGTSARYAAALASETGAGYEAVLAQLADETARLAPF